jgi:hypothetical protein
MFVQVKAGGDTHLTEHWKSDIETIVEWNLDRFEDRVTGVEVFISDETSGKKDGEGDKRCVIEAKLAGMEPIAVRTFAPTYDAAVIDCAEKLRRKLDHDLGRLADKDGQVSQSGDEMMGPLRAPLPKK